MAFATYEPGDTVRALHPRTLGVVVTARVEKVTRNYAYLRHEIYGPFRVLHQDVVSVEERGHDARA